MVTGHVDPGGPAVLLTPHKLPLLTSYLGTPSPSVEQVLGQLAADDTLETFMVTGHGDPGHPAVVLTPLMLPLLTNTWELPPLV